MQAMAREFLPTQCQIPQTLRIFFFKRKKLTSGESAAVFSVFFETLLA